MAVIDVFLSDAPKGFVGCRVFSTANGISSENVREIDFPVPVRQT